MYPPVEPHDSGLLDVGDGHQVYWEVAGNPDGIPAVYLHGGPGGTLKGGYRRRFDPERYLVVGVQQRGAGRSTPSAASPGYDLAQNTTSHLLSDLDAVRARLGIDAWLVSGVSWGSTLALHHALTRREATLGLVLVAVTTTSPDEVWWISEGVGRLYPEAWQRLASFASTHADWQPGEAPIIQVMAQLLADDALAPAAARAWLDWEDVHIQIGLPVDQVGVHHVVPAGAGEATAGAREDEVAFARLVTHYWSQAGFGPADGLTNHLAPLAGLPVALVHGRRDVSGPASIPWGIQQALPHSVLRVVETEGHGGEQMMELWRAAADSFADHGDFRSLVGHDQHDHDQQLERP